ncbi:filamentous hemagglutinin N-terminal domain-containing protein [Pelagerythrobacter marensis]|uniref:Filamentous haemagglutinin FhaB/tRNA nuclease CdiA-like TPS domain-containing protein n=1 Tax=Pelagerythrobacter marensis TaxID=543877 RepID=A0A0G3XAW7_9SPHN|nr:filamentous hemagglutinin N-terminal domain-containing protein [Pelagerythrobacter marensis]AKM07749.1 hypothetical protein AM2010_1683 [Pelagerythrobacter marensis]
MSVNATASKHPSVNKLKLGSSLFALAVTGAFASVASAQTAPPAVDPPFGTMVGMQAGRTIGPNGQMSVWDGANRPVIGMEGDRHLMTIEQTKAKAVLDWEDFRLKTQEILEFQQQSPDWLVINRVHGEHESRIDGEIRAIGSVYIFNDNGVLIGEDAQVNTRQLVVGSGISDVDVDGDTTTFVQSSAKAVLDWQKFRVDTGELLRFEQQSSDWLVINRDLGAADAAIDGTISAQGIVAIEDDTGFDIGENVEIDADRYFLTQGIADIDVTADNVTLTQGRERAIVNWSDLNLAAGKSLTLRQEGEGWTAINRHLGGGVARIDGTVRADQGIMLIARDGLAINGSIEAGQVIASALDIRDQAFIENGLISHAFAASRRLDPTFSNNWIYATDRAPDRTPDGLTNRYLNLLEEGPVVSDRDNPLLYGVTVGSKGRIATADQGKIMLFGPHVTNNGTLDVRDEGQVVLAAGENVFIQRAPGNDAKLDIYTSVHNALDIRPSYMSSRSYALPFLVWARDPETRKTLPTDSEIPAEWVDFVNAITGGKAGGGEYAAGDILPSDVARQMAAEGDDNIILQYIDATRIDRANKYGFAVRNNGVINGTGGSDVDLRGWTIEQNGAITLTSTANFRAGITMHALMQDAAVPSTLEITRPMAGNGTIVFGKGSLTQVTPDLESDDKLPLTEGNQSVGSIHVAGGKLHFREDSLVYLPSGKAEFYADADATVLSPLGASGNGNSQDGSRLMMDAGATIDLSGWEVSRKMGYHQVTGKVFVAQLKDSPVQDGGPLYRKEISVDRRYGTNVVDWESFDNLNQLTLDQMIVDGGSLTIAAGDDLILKSGSVIDVSGGSITYDAGYVYTTMLRRLDGTVIDIREADPDEVYMGLADQWVDYDTKWGKQRTYYVPLMSSSRGRYEESYVEGGNAGQVKIWAPDGVYQGTFRGEVTVGKYQRTNMPDAGALIINEENEFDSEYISTRVLIAQTLAELGMDFGFDDSLTGVYGDIFGEEEEREGTSDGKGNLTLISQDMFERSTMGRYDITQLHLRAGGSFSETADDGYDNQYIVLEDGVDLNFANGATFNLIGTSSMYFGGSITSNGGDVALRGQGIVFSDDSFIDTSAKWHSDYELQDYRPLAGRPIVHGGDILITAFRAGQINTPDDGTYEFILPETVYFNADGGGFLNREGELTAGTGGDINIRNYMALDNKVDLSGAFNARSLGLGGNGVFALESSGELYIGDTLPDDAAERNIVARIDPALFEAMPFSGIYLNAPKIGLTPGTHLKATKATMQLKAATLENGVPEAWLAESGTDIRDVTEIGYVEPGQRAKDVRNGALLAFSGIPYSDAYNQIGVVSLAPHGTSEGGRITLDAQSSLEVNPGGEIFFDGILAGSLIAPAGTITLGGHVDATARVLAPGAVRITDRRVRANGEEILLGEVLNGGEIRNLGPLTVAEGAIFDISGTSGRLHVPVRADGGTTFRERSIASDGGLISLYGSDIDVSGAVFRAAAGGEGARGGTFRLQWKGPDYDALTNFFGSAMRNKLSGAWYYKKDGSAVQGLAGIDLSTIDWSRSNLHNVPDFAEGTFLPDVDEVVAAFEAYHEAQAMVPAPVLYIGEGESSGAIDYGDLPEVDPAFFPLYEGLGYTLPDLPETAGTMNLSPSNLASGGFAGVEVYAGSAIVFAGESHLGGKAGDGSYLIDEIVLSAPRLYGLDDADFTMSANRVRITDRGTAGGVSMKIDEDRFAAALVEMGVSDDAEGTRFGAEAGQLIDVTSAEFKGFADVSLASEGDLRFSPTHIIQEYAAPEGALIAGGNLQLKADQVYTASGRIFTVEAGGTLAIAGPDAGTQINRTPLEGAASLTLRAPRIEQGGIVRSPLGSITFDAVDDSSEGAGTITLLPGSITSVSADGNTIPYGRLQNGDTWVDPFTRRELAYLPDREINLEADTIDFAEGAVVDISAGGDLVASEFVPGVGGSRDWLTGYRDDDHRWVADSSQVYAIIPGYDADVTPLGTGSGYDVQSLGKIYLSEAEGGLPAGEYTLLPAEYASLPGAYRVTAKHQYGDHSHMALGTSAPKADGSIIQAGYRFTAAPDGSRQYRDRFNTGFLVMDGDVLAQRTQYNIASATTYFDSEAFLQAARRRNLDVESLPRTPLDAGGLTLVAGSSLTLDGTVEAAAAEGGKGGYADISSARMVVTGAGTDLTDYEGYLQIDAERLVSFGVESLLLGGLRKQTESGTAIDVSAHEVVVDTAGTTLSGQDLILAALQEVSVKSGSVIEATGELTSPTESYTLSPAFGLFVDDKGSSYTGDDEFVHGELDMGAVLHVSAGSRAEFLRDSEAVDAMAALRANPERLATINAARAARGLAAIDATGGVLSIEGDAQLSGNALLLDGTRETTLAVGAALDAEQVSAAASQVSIGAAPEGTGGLVFGDGTGGLFASAQDVALKSYSSLDFYGSVDFAVEGDLTLDAREIRLLENEGGNAAISAQRLTLANSSGGEAEAAGGSASLLLTADEIALTGGMKAISGADSVTLRASERVVGRDTGGLAVPGSLTIEAGQLTVDSGDTLAIEAGGAIVLDSIGDPAEAANSLGATLSLTGASIANRGRIALHGGTVALRATQGDIALASGSAIDVSGTVFSIFDQQVGVNAGAVSLTADAGDVLQQNGALIDISGGEAADAGALAISVAQGRAVLDGTLKGSAGAGRSAGDFSLQIGELADFAGLNSALAEGGLNGRRAFEILRGDVILDGTTEVESLSVVANDGAMTVTGTVRTTGADGGRIALAASEGLALAAGSRLIAAAGEDGGSGGTVRIETAGRNGGVIAMAGGALIDVSGAEDQGGTVHFRAPQIGADDIAIDALAGEIRGADKAVAEAFRIYDNVGTIDGDLAALVGGDATAFMDAALANGVADRLGDATLVPGIEIRNDGDIELVENWDLSGLRFGPDQVAGILSLRATGDVLVNADLADDMAGGWNWGVNLVAGANPESPSVLGVLAPGLLADGKGSVVIGGVADKIDFVTLDPSDYDLSVIVGDPEAPDFSAGAFNLYFTAIALVNAGELPSSVGSQLNNIAGNASGYEEMLALMSEYLLDEHPNAFARSPAYGDEYQNLEALIDAQFIDRIADADKAEYRAIGYGPNGYHDGNATGREAFQRLVRFLGAGYPDIFRNVVLDVPTSPVAAAPYYLRVNGQESELRYVNPDGSLGAELDRDFATGFYYYFDDGGEKHLVRYDEGASDYADTDVYARAKHPWIMRERYQGEGDYYRGKVQTYDPVGYSIVAGTVNVAAARDLLLEQRPSSIRTSGAGGDIQIVVGRDIAAHDAVAKTVVTDIMTDGRASIDAGGAIHNLTVAAHDLAVRAGGDIAGGIYQATGQGIVTTGGSIVAGSEVKTYNDDFFTGDPQAPYADCNITSDRCHWDLDPTDVLRGYPLHAFFDAGEAGTLRVEAAGDLHVEAAYGGADASVAFYSAGGDISAWNNDYNIVSAAMHNGAGMPYYLDANEGINAPLSDEGQIWAGTVSMIAAGGDVNVEGGFRMTPAQHGNLDILARGNVRIGHYDRFEDAVPIDGQSARDHAWRLATHQNNYRSTLLGIYMMSPIKDDGVYWVDSYYQDIYGTLGERHLMLHEGDLVPSRIYAAEGDLVTIGGITSTEQLWMKAGGDVYFPNALIQHNNPGDVSQVTAGGGIYFGTFHETGDIYLGYGSQLHVRGPGAFEIEAGGDLWIPSNSEGITTDILYDVARSGFGGYVNVPLDPNMKAADIAISVGYNEQPAYADFESAYFDPANIGTMEDYLLAEAGDGERLPIYLFDRFYARGNGSGAELVDERLAGGFVNYIRSLQGLDPLAEQSAQQAYLDQAWDYWVHLPAGQETPFDALVPRYSAREAAEQGANGAFFVPERREGLVNYVRGLQGLEPLETVAEQRDYMNDALQYWEGLDTVYKTPFYRSVLFLELRTASREANDPDSDRQGSVGRGYTAIGTLYPGAEKEAEEDEGRWQGNFETFASRVLSNNGGNVSVVVPGGFFRLASAAASAEQTGQPSDTNIQGDALRAGVVTQGGGEVNILTHGDTDVNQSRVLTTQGGNILMWSSYGNIAAGNGAKTSLSPPYYNRAVDEIANLTRSPAGLPTGAGIGTLATTAGVAPADIDLVANHGIIDAGDAGIRVSGNLNVFAIEILGADNIDVIGRTTGLPETPAAPPTSLDVDDAGSKALQGGDALKETLESVRRGSAVVTPSIIEVRVTGYGEDACDGEEKRCEPVAQGSPTGRSRTSAPEIAMLATSAGNPANLEFDIPQGRMETTLRAIARASGLNIVYNDPSIDQAMARPVRGRMTVEQALQELVRRKGLEPVRVDSRTIMLRPKVS